MTIVPSDAPLSVAAAARHRSSPPIALRYAWRELRSGLQGFYVFIACIALGVFAIAGVGSLASSLTDGLSRQGRTLLGGDAAFSLIQREAKPEERAFLDRAGKVTSAATLRAMARATADRFALIDLKAVDGAYPLFGSVDLEPAIPLADLFAERDGAFGAAVDQVLLARLDMKVGDRFTIGSTSFTIRSVVKSEPDKLAGGIGLGPRVLVSEAALRATGLLQPGSLVRWSYRVQLPGSAVDDAAVVKLLANARAALPDAGWEVRSRANASPQLERNIERFTQFLTLVGLAALLVGGVGVANAIKSHLDRKRDVIATLKALGARGRDVFAMILVQVTLLAGIGSLIGVVIGGAMPFLVAKLFGALLPLPITPSVQPAGLALAFAYGLLTALAFALWPLGRVPDVPVSVLFRDAAMSDGRWPRRTYVVAVAVTILLLAAVAVSMAYDRRIAIIFIFSAAAVFVLLRLIAEAVMDLARRAPSLSWPMLRLAVANIHRPGALTPSVVLSLGLGLTVLVTITQIDANLRRQFLGALPEKAPSFFFVDIPSAESERFASFLKQQSPGGVVEEVPMLRGRIVSARGVGAEQLNPSPEAAWVLQSDRGLTYAREIPRGSTLVEGEWWASGYDGPPLVSFEKKLADGLGLKLGDPVTVNVLGRNITATIANTRSVDWQSLGINFVLVFSPNAFRGAPHSYIATLTEQRSAPETDAAIVRAVAEAFPSVTSVRVREALQTVGTMVANLVLAIRAASGVTLLAAMLVLGGALAAGHRHRVYDAVILKTLGATRSRLIGAYAAEYAMIGLATAVFGVLAGSVAAWLIVTRLMNLTFAWDGPGAVLVAAGALAVTVGLGLAGTLVALSRKPAQVLREL